MPHIEKLNRTVFSQYLTMNIASGGKLSLIAHRHDERLQAFTT